MDRRRHPVIVLMALTTVPALGTTPDYEPPVASVYAGLELGNSDTRRVEAGGTWRPQSDWTANLALAHAEFDFPGTDTASTVGSAKAAYQWGDIGIGAGVRRGEIDEVSVTRGWLITGSYVMREWRLSGEIEARDSALAAAAFDDEEIPGVGRVSGTARCDVDSLGLGALANYSQSRWSGFAAVRLFHYGDFDCKLDIAGSSGGPRPPRSRGRGLGNRLANNTLKVVTGFSPRLIPREATLLESTVAVGATYSLDETWLGGAELYRDVERASGDDFMTALAFANRRMTDTLSLEVWIGYATATFDDTAFAGVRVEADL
jgi:hypothetical protein